MGRALPELRELIVNCNRLAQLPADLDALPELQVFSFSPVFSVFSAASSLARPFL